MSKTATSPKEETRGVDLVDEIELELSRQRALARLLSGVFELLGDPNRDTSLDVANGLWEGVQQIAEDMDDALERVNRDVRKLHEFGLAKAGAR